MPVHCLYQNTRRNVVLGRRAEEYALSLQVEKDACDRPSFEELCHFEIPSVNLRRLNFLLD